MAKEFNTTTIDTTPASAPALVGNRAALAKLAKMRQEMATLAQHMVQENESAAYLASVAENKAVTDDHVAALVGGVTQAYGHTGTFAIIEHMAASVASVEDFKVALREQRALDSLPNEAVRSIITVMLLKHKAVYRDTDNYDPATCKAISKDKYGKPSALYMQVRRIMQDTAPEASKQKAAKPEKTMRERLETFMSNYTSDATIAALVEMFGKKQLHALIDACKDSAADVESHTAKVAAERGKGKTKPATVAQPA